MSNIFTRTAARAANAAIRGASSSTSGIRGFVSEVREDMKSLAEQHEQNDAKKRELENQIAELKALVQNQRPAE